MPTRYQQFHALENPVLLDQISGSFLMYATSVLVEDPTTPQHASRVAYANFVIGDSYSGRGPITSQLKSAELFTSTAGNSDGTDGSPCLDADVDAFVAANWNRFKVISGFPDDPA